MSRASGSAERGVAGPLGLSTGVFPIRTGLHDVRLVDRRAEPVRVDPVDDSKLPTNAGDTVSVVLEDGPSEPFERADPDVARAPLVVLVACLVVRAPLVVLVASLVVRAPLVVLVASLVVRASGSGSAAR